MHFNLLAAIWASFTWDQLPAYAGTAFVVASLFMKTMIPLRGLSMASNVCFIVYAYMVSQYPTLVMHLLLLPLNGVRLYQMAKLVRRVQAAADGDNTLTWLKPYMTRRQCKAEEMIFRKGDRADSLFFIVSGEFRVPEIGVKLQPGRFIGELGLLAPDGQRTQSFDCVAGGELLSISYEHVKELYFQNPDFGFYFLQLATGRLFENMSNLEHQVATLRAEANK